MHSIDGHVMVVKVKIPDYEVDRGHFLGTEVLCSIDLASALASLVWLV
jgi:hypothetical protein